MEQVTHGVDEVCPRLLLFSRTVDEVGVKRKFEAISVSGLFHTLQPQSHRFSIATPATRTDLRAAGSGIPRVTKDLNRHDSM